jgi:hypothetical protein
MTALELAERSAAKKARVVVALWSADRAADLERLCDRRSSMGEFWGTLDGRKWRVCLVDDLEAQLARAWASPPGRRIIEFWGEERDERLLV